MMPQPNGDRELGVKAGPIPMQIMVERVVTPSGPMVVMQVASATGIHISFLEPPFALETARMLQEAATGLTIPKAGDL